MAVEASRKHPKIVSEPLGHTTIRVTMDIYNCVLPDMQREMVAAMERKGQRRLGSKLGSNAPNTSKEEAITTVRGHEKSRLNSGFTAEGVGFEPTVGSYPYSGLANRRTRPDYATLPDGAKGGTRTPTRVTRTTP